MLDNHAQPGPRAAGPRGLFPPRRVGGRRGAIIVITLLALVLLASLVFYVLNLGQQTNERLVTQHAADATVMAGAGWAARTYNTVAMNNVALTHLAAAVNALDAFPVAVRLAHHEQSALSSVLEDHLRQGIDASWVRDPIQTMAGEVALEVANLEPLDHLLNHSTFDMRTVTYYSGPSGRGSLWTAMQALDEYNQTAMETLERLTQFNAIRGGYAVLHSSDAASLLVPAVHLVPVPWKRGHFDDLERPVRFGLLPGAHVPSTLPGMGQGALTRPQAPNSLGQVDDKVTNRGPWDALFGWRHLRWTPILGEPVWREPTPPSYGGASGGRGNVPIGSGAPSGGGGGSGGWYRPTIGRTLTHYTVWGPHEEFHRRVGDYSADRLHWSRFAKFARELSDIKMRYVWPGQTDLQTYTEPRWTVGVDAAAAAAAGDPAHVVETLFVATEIKSKYPEGHALFLSPGTWAYINAKSGWPGRRLDRRGGWVDPRGWVGGPVDRVGDFAVRDHWTYTVTFDSEIGIERITDSETGAVVPQTVYRIDNFIFVAVVLGYPLEVGNPYDGIGERDDLPAPLDFDHTRIGDSAADRRGYLTYLGVSRKGDRAMMWPGKFAGNKPFASKVAIAQGQVFNNHSWDLWTQMWHASLEPVTDYQAWMDTMGATAEMAGAAPELSTDEYLALEKYLRSLQPLADVMLRH